MTTEKKPHKWAKEIHAWADGAEIQSRAIHHANWYDVEGPAPFWNAVDLEYRIKPEPVVCDAHIVLCDGRALTSLCDGGNIRCTFDPTTGELINVKLIPKEGE